MVHFCHSETWRDRNQILIGTQYPNIRINDAFYRITWTMCQPSQSVRVLHSQALIFFYFSTYTWKKQLKKYSLQFSKYGSALMIMLRLFFVKSKLNLRDVFCFKRLFEILPPKERIYKKLRFVLKLLINYNYLWFSSYSTWHHFVGRNPSSGFCPIRTGGEVHLARKLFHFICLFLITFF